MNFVKELKNLPQLVKTSGQQLKDVKSLTGCSMITALNVVVGFCKIQLTPTLQIGFTSLFAAISGMVYGPVITGLAGVIADHLKFMLHPTGPYFIGFPINEFLTGFIYGCFFYKKKITIPRVILARLTITVFINLILTSLWLNIMYQSPLFTVARLVKNVVMFPIDCFLLYTALKTGEKILKPMASK